MERKGHSQQDRMIKIIDKNIPSLDDILSLVAINVNTLLNTSE
jgi:hypothetical protein